MSGEGARLLGGRWNQRDGTATIYLASPEATCHAEITRLVDREGTGRVRFPRTLHTISVDNLRVIDLRDEARLAMVQLTLADIAADHRTPCQRVGEAVSYLGYEGLVAPSATGTGLVIAAYEPRISLSQLIVLDSSEVALPPAD